MIVKLFFAVLIFAAIIVLTQTFQIFPVAFFSLAQSKVRDPHTLPRGVESFTVKTTDNVSIEIWKLTPKIPPRGAAFFTHGNGGTMAMFFPFQEWLAELGFVTYSYDYRGYGCSTGWPSENGVKRDIDAVWKFLSEHEQIKAEDLTIVGLSLGTTVASYLASKNEPKALVLMASFPSVRAVVEKHLIFRYLKAFLFWELPTATWVSQLQKSCFTVIHGSEDGIIDPILGVEVFKAYKGSGKSTYIELPDVGHNDLLYKKDELSNAVLTCAN